MEENNNFFDRNTVLAIVISLVFFMGWQTYMQKKYPEAYKPKKKTEQVKAQTEQNLENSEAPTQVSNEAEQSEPAHKELVQKPVDQTIEVSNDLWTGKLTSLGMGLKEITLKEFSDRKENNIQFVSGPESVGNFSTYVDGQPLNFAIEKKSDNHIVGTARVGNQSLLKEMMFDPKNYTVSVSVKTLSGSAQGKTLLTKISSQVLKVKSSMFTPAYEGTEFFSIDNGSEERERIDIESPYSEKLGKTTLTSIGSQYFALALKDDSPVVPRTEVDYKPEGQYAYASIFHEPVNGQRFEVQFTGFMGPKKYDILKTLGSEYVQMINYGMFSILSKPMLSMLKWLYDMFKNWGLAIIFLTIFIRLLLLPINISSLKSMKKMQKIQPQLKAIKEKYKDDPVKVNQETMALMKKEGANPLGGCLPMLLQLPVFFALYSVLGQSVELYKSPFIFWIQDLSYQDPFFVLPVAVGALYFIQMSITPQPTDPAQAKVMKFIPILFCFFMITVPSGLTLYFFVNTVFGIGQSFIFQREKKKAAA